MEPPPSRSTVSVEQVPRAQPERAPASTRRGCACAGRGARAAAPTRCVGWLTTGSGAMVSSSVGLAPTIDVLQLVCVSTNQLRGTKSCRICSTSTRASRASARPAAGSRLAPSRTGSTRTRTGRSPTATSARIRCRISTPSPGSPAWSRPTPARRRRTASYALTVELIDEIRAADTILLGLPVYNFGAPSTIKSWVDHLIAPGLSVDPATKEGPARRPRPDRARLARRRLRAGHAARGLGPRRAVAPARPAPDGSACRASSPPS